MPLALHEATRIPGKATRALSRVAHRLYLPHGVRLPGRLGLLVRHTGLPVRREIVRLARTEARARLGIDPAQKLVAVLGGSQGAGPLNRWVEDNLAALAQEGVQVWCVTGMGKGEVDVREFPGRNGQVVRAWREPFCDRMGVLISAADLAISRAGAGTLAELVRCETPAILVPYPFAADNHQQANAAYFEQQGGGLVVAETALGGLRQEVLDTVFNDWLLNKFRTNLRRMAYENSIEVIVNDL
ncbi:MAG: UDP-N-acetylglucosamine--N-acetylmuramyl-(pentapeptide) pyrophosphoryl-undecaprenol, partial [Verrucomicrobiota bacterium]|nr:UDP-N-acetylglucosamine--N-acetylmuramyl-(pentapeptide) pyrophosphoryl-undecaprenol [Verrucomicrobiota bacterium]